MAKNAPTSIIPSRPMFTTPDRSEKIPPIAANASGVAKRRVAAISPAVKIPSSVSRSTALHPDARAGAQERDGDRPQPELALAPGERGDREGEGEEAERQRDAECSGR